MVEDGQWWYMGVIGDTGRTAKGGRKVGVVVLQRTQSHFKDTFMSSSQSSYCTCSTCFTCLHRIAHVCGNLYINMQYYTCLHYCTSSCTIHTCLHVHIAYPHTTSSYTYCTWTCNMFTSSYTHTVHGHVTCLQVIHIVHGHVLFIHAYIKCHTYCTCTRNMFTSCHTYCTWTCTIYTCLHQMSYILYMHT